MAVLDLDAPPALSAPRRRRPGDQLSDHGLRHDVRVVVRAVGEQRPNGDTWRARLVPRSGTAHLRTALQRFGLAADRWDRTVTSRFTRRRPRG